MTRSFRFFVLFILTAGVVSCRKPQPVETKVEAKPVYTMGMYGYDASFLREHTNQVVELSNEDHSAKILLSAEYQGRVMTSTAKGDSGVSFGWINYKLLGSEKKIKQFNPVGGEERFWLGPEGGQYALYFKKGDSFDLDHWQVPAILDTLPYEVSQASPTQALFTAKASLTNYSGTPFSIGIERRVNLLDRETIASKLNVSIPESLSLVGYETENKIQNLGKDDWKKEKGLLSIWLLGMMTPSDQTTVMIPFHAKANSRQLITDNYFGTIPPERLQVTDSVVYFRCDGKLRSKIGLSPRIAKTIATSYDFRQNVLTLILFPVDNTGRYVNSTWKLQDQPYQGDVVNAYNDGPQADGTQMGPFYEIESSSTANELKAGQSQTYRQMTCHFQGDYETLRTLMQSLTGIDLNTLKN
ncbi:hypothetical protein SAMN04488109_5830 [Chryseolinea serpens]|uniref:Lipoprotein n=1 Tax=Chryseolinea serpens TaxID=947013 RepID=A0A1M5WMN4_9BACT|nr:DUF6786 family protein [Chryseolinea serpens]SHH88652.1 hypothetical protein SAMN04488109_5830 [Chryseolinea serpens]